MADNFSPEQAKVMAAMRCRFEDRLKYEVKKKQTHDGSPLG